MSFAAQEEFDSLHGLRIKGMTQPEHIASATGLDPAVVREVLDDAVAQGRARSRTGGRVQGYMLTSAGRERHDELRADHVPDRLDDLAGAYKAFLAPNRAFKSLTTRWQTEAAGEVSAIVPELRTIHESVTAVLAAAVESVPRMKSYEPRFADALAAFESGDGSALAKPMSGSYHDVWMELHEDLLLTLGWERSDADE
ncbi:hypothetical protein [Nocardia jinanensis]|uniref:Uncharacterized protein n=1 Tax=Nocardia jinanensis TaxID=382504 RepID=A0A917RNU5_9NOCA|nr:hypothetical protein [Nocardia jinanensis]GGL16003.1 hypothetical protein GCM10011588_33340 [Nocardia jinanensis]